ncbi:type II toxin-antitoxin system PemK/MazF family toxin [Nostoc sp. UHCC 0702]|nr:type II toxin-antitoxin system PemK/MazF family toxin [Nostoc sp. UHCC 0702]
MTELVEESSLVGNSGNALEFGDIITYNFGDNPDPSLLRAGREEAFERPAVVITSSNFNKKTNFAWISPITKVDKSDKTFISQIPLPSGLRTYGFVLSDQLTFVNCSSPNVIDVREKAPDFVKQIIPQFISQLPVLNNIKEIISLSVRTGVTSQFYKPDFGHIITYDIYPLDNNRHTPPLAFVVTPLAFNKETKLAWVCPIVTNSTGYIYEFPLPDNYSDKGVILLDQLHTLNWKTRNCRPRYQFPFDGTKIILHRIHEIISSSLE